MNEPKSPSRYRTDGDKLRLLHDAAIDPAVTDGVLRAIVCGLLNSDRMTDDQYRWGMEQVERIECEGVVEEPVRRNIG